MKKSKLHIEFTVNLWMSAAPFGPFGGGGRGLPLTYLKISQQEVNNTFKRQKTHSHCYFLLENIYISELVEYIL